MPNAVVLIPAYNAATTIGETLKSLQTNPDLDRIKSVIVLDDASSDETSAVARSAWRSQVPFEVWSNKQNSGERITTNTGFARLPADIEWAFILHADDVVKPNWMSLHLNEMIGCPDNVAAVSSSWDNWYPESGRIIPGEERPDRPTVLVSGSRQAVLDTLNTGCWFKLSGCAIRTEVFRQIGGFKADMPQMGDWEWLLRCLAKGFSVLYLPLSTTHYRQHATSVSSKSFREARDIREKLFVFATYRNQEYLSPADYQKKINEQLYQLFRRMLVRALRLDLIGMRYHAHLLAEISARYVLRRL